MLQIDIISTNAESPYPVSVEQLASWLLNLTLYHVIVDILCELHINKQFCYCCSLEYHHGNCES